MPEPVRVLIVDDQQLVRGGFRMLLDSQPDLEVVAESGDGADAVRAVERLRRAGAGPDVVLMDVRMPVLDGIAATRQILARHGTDVRIVVLTTFDLDEYALDALRAGASGFLLKDALPEELLAAVRTVHRGDAVIAPSTTRRLIGHFVEEPAAGSAGDTTAPRPHAAAIATLTAREHEVFLLMARGLSNGEIMGELFLSEATVKTHVSHVLAKLGVRDRVQAVVLAYESGLMG
ncbi:response regulator [Kocuria sediminis]|uniref:Response regulator n=1 Tax=Kocuria sediminis TaxID=1038857 RepID=A0A6N8GLU2_9MICC|nr:response regulator [Kocuria sediminis]